ncbi:MAG: hypothetical protein U0869_26055 [Chloroflexota bacterium]
MTTEAPPAAPDAAPEEERFPIRIQRPFGPLLRLIFGVRPGERAMVTLTADTLDACFGWSRLHVPLADITSWDITGPYRWYTAIGVRRSIRGGDLTFGGSAHGGVQVRFRVRPAFFFFRPPSFYFTVDDLEGLGAALTARGIPGVDLRVRRAG